MGKLWREQGLQGAPVPDSPPRPVRERASALGRGERAARMPGEPHFRTPKGEGPEPGGSGPSSGGRAAPRASGAGKCCGKTGRAGTAGSRVFDTARVLRTLSPRSSPTGESNCGAIRSPDGISLCSNDLAFCGAWHGWGDGTWGGHLMGHGRPISRCRSWEMAPSGAKSARERYGVGVRAGVSSGTGLFRSGIRVSVAETNG